MAGGADESDAFGGRKVGGFAYASRREPAITGGACAGNVQEVGVEGGDDEVFGGREGAVDSPGEALSHSLAAAISAPRNLLDSAFPNPTSQSNILPIRNLFAHQTT